jgi:hypothetical protein
MVHRPGTFCPASSIALRAPASRALAVEVKSGPLFGDFPDVGNGKLPVITLIVVARL